MAEVDAAAAAGPPAEVIAASAAAPTPVELPADPQEAGEPPALSLGRVYCTSSSAVAAEWCRKLVVGSWERSTVEFHQGEQIEK
jgi:hypothetical protein